MRFLITFIVLLMSAVSLHAQVGTANLAGAIRDDAGNPLPGASVSALHVDTGLVRSAIAIESGIYRIPSLPNGTYDITAQVPRFATLLQKGIHLDVGRTVTVDFSMKLSTSGEIIEVTGRTPLIETSQSHIATIVSAEQLENLPLNGRQFANLAALAPGTSLTIHPDPTRIRSLAVSLIGGTGRNLNVIVDGGDNADDAVGGINQFYSLEAVAEFDFLTNRYEAEYGRSNGGVLNVVTKSGSNVYHGSFFSLFQDESWAAFTESEKKAKLTDRVSTDRQQFGGSVGGPVVQNKAFFFFAAERTQADQQLIVNTLGIAPEFNTITAIPTDDNLYTAKFTYNLSAIQNLNVRYGQQNTKTIFGAAPTVAANALGDYRNDLHSILVNHNYQRTEGGLNEFTFQYSDFNNSILPTSNDSTEFFPNGVLLGQNPSTPQTTILEKYQFKDDFSFQSAHLLRGAHHFKTGIHFVHEPSLSGTFTFGTIPLYTHLSNSRDSAISDITIFGGILAIDLPNNQTGFYFQDDWNFNNRLTLNLGIRYDIITGLELDQSANLLYQDLHHAPYDFSWLQPFRNSADGRIETDKNNFQPRLGFAYDLKGDGETVLRGGWGLYYDFPYANANLAFPQAALGGFGIKYNVSDPSGIRNSDGTLFHVGEPLPPNQLPGLSSFAPRDALSPDWRVPYSSQSSIGISHQIDENSAVDADYIHAAGRDQFIRFQFNGRLPGQTTNILPNFSNGSRIYFPGGFSDYDGLNLTYRRLFDKGFQFQASYTLSRVKGNLLPGSDEFQLGSSPACPHCAYDFRLGPEEDPKMVGPLNTDARHRVVLAGIYDLPYKIRVSGFFRANSARPFNGFVEGDLNGDGFLYDTTDPHVNAHRDGSFAQLDIRIGKIFRVHSVKIEGILEIFNLFNAENPAGFVGDLDSQAFGKPTSFSGDPGRFEQRLAQIGFRIDF